LFVTSSRRATWLLAGLLGVAGITGLAEAQRVGDGGLWASLGVGAANGGLAVGAASLWLDIHRITIGARLSDAETPLGAAGSRIEKKREGALLLGWRVSPGLFPVSLALAGGVSTFGTTATEGDNRQVVEVSNQSGPTVDGELGLGFTKHIGAGCLFSP
jgi:hypothetical protein